MRYRCALWALIIVSALILTGCACSHEWLPAGCEEPQLCAKCEEAGEPALGHDWGDATCTAPQTCARCGVTGQPALGHDWIGATCTDPETCSRCSATQGEALGHSFGDWTFGEDDMTHACSVCSFEETAAFDHDLYLGSMLEGYWDLWALDHLDDDAPAHDGASYLYEAGKAHVNYLVFGENRSCQITMSLSGGSYEGIGTWELVNCFDDSDGILWQFYVHTTSPRVEDLVLELHEYADGTSRVSFTGGNFVMWFYQVQQEDLDIICTNYAVTDHFSDHSYCFQIRPDRTATCYVEGVFEGTWCVGAYQEDSDTVAFNISYERNGKEEAFIGYIQLRGPDISAPQLNLTNGYSELWGNYKYIPFVEVNDEELAIVQGATDLLAGTWTSIGFRSPNPLHADPLTADYSITIEKNNRFTLSLPDGRTYSGNWAAYATSEGHYQYYLYFTQQRKNVACVLETRVDRPYLGIDEVGSDDNTLYFQRMREEELLGPTLPLGTWLSDRGYDNATGQEIDTDGLSITFHENGTFTAVLDRELRGTWRYYIYDRSTVYGSDGSEASYDTWTYVLFREGSDDIYMTIERSTFSETFSFFIRVTDAGGNSISYHFSRN